MVGESHGGVEGSFSMVDLIIIISKGLYKKRNKAPLTSPATPFSHVSHKPRPLGSYTVRFTFSPLSSVTLSPSAALSPDSFFSHASPPLPPPAPAPSTTAELGRPLSTAIVRSSSRS
ncbi:uncharacterized protein THITE_2093455 [Thermothielavioides terrestris NRRL 8126]|uniref:Uncharacterized protein n=1 Tax=Thermothielavioides terrestris (strain ATCC 38088 / NRRL 8126) TaxID=578455 RepID=G2RGW9_THETT|nr:uncharacterized protein THITE_2093455 [Thermothielavioides terrestris NRRL 8126]AEO71954.1 hypothetical protein THITE_2093455 [Thermothielavioides terrestris NRRL 8126]